MKIYEQFVEPVKFNKIEYSEYIAEEVNKQI